MDRIQKGYCSLWPVPEPVSCHFGGSIFIHREESLASFGNANQINCSSSKGAAIGVWWAQDQEEEPHRKRVARKISLVKVPHSPVKKITGRREGIQKFMALNQVEELKR